MIGKIYIVHHVDTEGPLYEPVEEIFDRLNSILGFDLNIPPTNDNLSKLQNGELISSKELRKTIKSIIKPSLVDFKNDWTEIDEMLRRITSRDFRQKYKDSYDQGWIFNWHLLDHVGFKTNMRRRDIGYSNIFNHYKNFFNENHRSKDDFQWHFHPISFKKDAHKCATSYANSFFELNQILCRRIIDYNWFPQVNRAGFHTIRPDSNWFLEQWMPFDASNQSVSNDSVSLQTDEVNGRFGDWKGAPNDWSLYNPDLYDWRKKGNLNRYISRTLNLNTRFRTINSSEIKNAFEYAMLGNDVYLGITNHDFREMSDEIDDFYKLFKTVSKSYPKVRYINENSLNAFRKVIGYKDREIIENKLDFSVILKNNVLNVKINNGEPFGSQPYLAIKTIGGEYYHDNFDFGEFKKEYFYTFDSHTLDLKEILQISVASNDKYGNLCIKNISI